MDVRRNDFLSRTQISLAVTGGWGQRGQIPCDGEKCGVGGEHSVQRTHDVPLNRALDVRGMRRASVAAARSPRTRRRQRQEPRLGPCSWAWAAPSRPRSGPRAPRGGRRASGRISGVPHAAAEPRARALTAGGSEPHASWGELRTLDRRCRGRREVAARLLGAWRDAACRACADCVPRPVSCVLRPGLGPWRGRRGGRRLQGREAALLWVQPPPPPPNPRKPSCCCLL